jgi:predicted nucleotidyltransferase
MTWDQRLLQQIAAQPDPLLFITISGAHLYGFPSPDSDYDLRGVHQLPLNEVLGLHARDETREQSDVIDSLEIDLVTHDVKKFFGLLLKKNGYVLEQLYSPLVVHSTPEFEELRDIARGCITRFHAYHYLGFVETQWKLFNKDYEKRVKPLLYVFRVLLTGIHLMRSGVIEANLRTLNDGFHLPYMAGPEQSILPDADLEFFKSEFFRLRTELETAMLESSLPEQSTCTEALNDLLVRVRLKPRI